MKVELLYITDCSNYEMALRLLKQALRENGLSEAVSEIEVHDFEQAGVLAFPGSPTIRVDGKDLEAAMPEQNQYGLSCRTYIVDQKRQGFPSRNMIRDAIRCSISAVKNR
jgi:hypothetical protein